MASEGYLPSTLGHRSGGNERPAALTDRPKGSAPRTLPGVDAIVRIVYCCMPGSIEV